MMLGYRIACNQWVIHLQSHPLPEFPFFSLTVEFLIQERKGEGNLIDSLWPALVIYSRPVPLLVVAHFFLHVEQIDWYVDGLFSPPSLWLTIG